MVYFGMHECIWSNQDWLPEAIEGLKLRLQERARTSGQSFKTIGVALDWRTEAGLRHLRKFGKFDELSVGRNWANSTAMKYIWQEFPGRPATPQVVLIERHVEVPDSALNVRSFVITDERVVLRKVGVDSIREWFASDIGS